MYLNLNDQQQFRLNKVNEVKDYVNPAITERKLIGESGGISNASFATVIGAPGETASASFSFAFSATTEIVK